MAPFCGLCGSRDDYVDDYVDDGDVAAAEQRRPLLARYGDETDRQRRLHQKLHTYQMARALADGFLPSTAQAVANLRTLLAADALTTHHRDLSASGRSLVRLAGRWLEQLIALLQRKNGEDQVQDFVWCLGRARVAVDVEGSAERLARTAGQASAHTSAAYRSLQTVGTLLLTNAPFRLFLADLTAVGRDVFRDTASALGDASHAAAKNVEAGNIAVAPQQAANGADGLPQARDNLADVAGEATTAAAKAAAEAQQSAASKLVDNDEGARDRLLGRLKAAVASLRQRPDYAESVSVLTVLLQRYAVGYVHAAEAVVEEVVDEVREREAVQTNDEADAALRNFWAFLTTLGDAEEWQKLEARFRALLDRSRGDNKPVDALLRDVGRALEALLTDPTFFDDIDARLAALKKQVSDLEQPSSSSSSSPQTSVRDDLDALLAQAATTLHAAAKDRHVAGLADTTTRIADLLWPAGAYANADLLGDAVSVFVPQLVQALQYVPIPRLEVVSPDVDLLLENLVLEPGRTVNSSSFLPYRLQVQIRNDVDIHKTRPGAGGGAGGTAAQIATSATVQVRGLSVAADEIGYVLRVHAGPFLKFSDEGVASFHLDERGVDVRLDVDVVRDAADRVLALRRTHVQIHHFDFALRRSRVSWLMWALKPVLRPLLRKTLEHQLAASIRSSLRALNQELVFARERLRAAQIASEGHGGGSGLQSLPTLLRAVAARYHPPARRGGGGSTRISIGLEGETGAFEGVYAPGSLARVWREEAAAAQDRIEAYERGGWRNGIFDVPTAGG